jgi:hypothetical protein
MFEEDTEAVLGRWIANRCHWTSFPKTLDYRLGFRVVHPEERSSRLAPLGLVLPQRQADKHRGKGHLARLTRTQRGSWGDLDMAAVSLTRSSCECPKKRPLDESPGRPGFSYVFGRTIFVLRTQMFCGNRSRLNDDRQSGLNGSASKERFLIRVQIPACRYSKNDSSQ